MVTTRRRSGLLTTRSSSSLVLCWVVVALLITTTIHAFTASHQPVRRRSSTSWTTSSSTRPCSSSALSASVGDVLLGLVGAAPDRLDPPVDLLAGTSIDPVRPSVELGRVYKASADGWSAADFHARVDGRGSGLVVALDRSGKRFGGFDPLGWSSTDDYGDTNAAWLWCVAAADDVPVRVPVLAGGSAAVFDYATGGPRFGAADLVIGPPRAAVMGGFAGPDTEDTRSNAGSLRECSSAVGGAYETPPSRSSWPYGSSRLVEVEVYCNTNIDPNDGVGGGVGVFDWWPF